MKSINQLIFLFLFSLLLSCNSNNSSTDASDGNPLVEENAIPSPFVKKLTMKDISFDIHAANEGGKNFLTITPTGLSLGDVAAEYELDGLVTDAQVADMNGDEWPEVLVFSELGSQNKKSYVVIYSVNDGKSMSEVYLPNVIKDTEYGIGFRGGDQYHLVDKYLIHQFPVYKTADADGSPTDGTRQVQYQLVDTETVKAFEVVSVTNAPQQ